MKFLWHCISLLLLSISSISFSQTYVTSFNHDLDWKGKPSLDTTALLQDWPRITQQVSLSHNGKYCAYLIAHFPKGLTSLIITSLDGSWQKKYASTSISDNFFFTIDDQHFIFSKADTVHVLSFPGGQSSYISSVLSFANPKYKKGEWVVIHLKNKELILLNLINGLERRFHGVVDYVFENKGRYLVLQKNSQDSIILQSITLPSLEEKTLFVSKCSGCQNVTFSNFDFDDQGEQLCFFINGMENNAIGYYKVGMPKAIVLLDDDLLTNKTGYRLKSGYNPLKFSQNGKYLFFQLLDTIVSYPRIEGHAVQLDIWSYKDVLLQPAQLEVKKTGDLEAILSLKSGQILHLASDERSVDLLNTPGDFIVFEKDWDVPVWWPSGLQKSNWIISLSDGKRKLIGHNIDWGEFSPHGKYWTYWDRTNACYKSYNVRSEKSTNITQAIGELVNNDYNPEILSSPVSEKTAGWFDNDTALLIYDNYDIWKVDPNGKNTPLNITNGYGKRKGIKLRLVYEKGDLLTTDMYSGNETLLLTGFNQFTKYNGFFTINLPAIKDPVLKTMGGYIYCRKYSQRPRGVSSNGMQPIKADSANIWIVQRESPTEAPNYFYTRDFNKFEPISNLQPQKEYNWLTTELVTWKMFDGRTSQGVLYKPENFDSTYKYPIIFNYYEARSYKAFNFPFPSFTFANINIPWFVSNGYLVFEPDILFRPSNKKGKMAGQYAYNAVVSAAEVLAKRRYVDGKRMAIQGVSFGGWLTAYLATHTNTFAAACESAGFTDIISNYLALHTPLSQTKDMQTSIENGHFQFSATPWSRPDLYLESSPVLHVDKASTPLLIVHGMKDDDVNWHQGAELYLAYRRLGKVCWMLSYNNGGHGLTGKDPRDLTVRLTQYFDHLLKGSPAPLWMTAGIPGKLKGIENGYRLDPGGCCSNKCKFCQKWNSMLN